MTKDGERTSLLEAAACGDVLSIYEVLKNGANVNEKREEGNLIFIICNFLF